jgi:DNA-binding beta-propeller fold protein YncE
MMVSDAVSGKVITSAPIGDGCDGVSFDPASKRIFASNGEGTITVIQQISADQYKVLETIPTQAGARTITLDKTSHRIYVSGGEYGEGTGRRPIKPNTFRVIELEPVK